MDMPRVISVKIGMQPPQNLVNAFHMSGVARKSKQQQYSFRSLIEGEALINGFWVKVTKSRKQVKVSWILQKTN